MNFIIEGLYYAEFDVKVGPIIKFIFTNEE